MTAREGPPNVVGSARWCLERGEAGGALAVRPGLQGSGCDAIFVDEPVTGGGSSDLLVEFDHGRVALVVGCSLAETTVGAGCGGPRTLRGADGGRGRAGAPCRRFGRWVSPARPPNRTCDFHRIRLSTRPLILTVLEHPVPQYPPRADARGGSSVFTVDFCHAGLLLLSGCPPSPCDRLSRPRTTTGTPPRHGVID